MGIIPERWTWPSPSRFLRGLEVFAYRQLSPRRMDEDARLCAVGLRFNLATWTVKKCPRPRRACPPDFHRKAPNVTDQTFRVRLRVWGMGRRGLRDVL
jgi:hypothetical protein